MDHTCTYDNLTSFEYKTHHRETEIVVNLLKVASKNSWNHIKWTYFVADLTIWNHCAVSTAVLIANYFPWENSSNGHTTPIMKKGLLTQRQCCYFSTSIWQPHLFFQSEFFSLWMVLLPRLWRKDWRKDKGFAILAQLIRMIYPTNNSVF